VSSALTSNAVGLAGEIGQSSGMTAAEVLANAGGAGASPAVGIAQDVALAGRVTGQIGKGLGLVAKGVSWVSVAATAVSVGVRAGCAMGWW
jgi:hypothetical protein